MFDIGWSELFVIGIVALLVLGPEELPRAMRKAGQWAAKARGMARHFQAGIDEMVRQSELDDLRKQLRETQSKVQSEVAAINRDISGPMEAPKSAAPVPAAPPPPPAPAPAMQAGPELLDGFGPKAVP
jgi:sec-independent protein translocase protein TatB